ncbi:MAG: pantoate--beta-alanine ligase [Desulfobacteraceae bacterium]|nr:pantoate--beta-alanine ligase [Desulfobacteraceae bacterium]
MKVIKKVEEMQQWSESVRKRGETVGLVPTMGYFHEGHLSLMETAGQMCDHLVVSLFVNPAQFGENEDLDAYPVDLDRDYKLAEEKGASVVFAPPREEVYPERFQTSVALASLPRHLCGLDRPVHFGGVATVVTKLFNIVGPQVAVFGAKDFQQLQVIRQLVKDLNFNIRIVGNPIVREADGLAMSSRNVYLSTDERASALSLSRSLELAEGLIRDGGKDAAAIRAKVVELITGFDHTAIDYVAVCDPDTLEDVDSVTAPVLVALAVKVGTTRLIDNRVIDPAQ